MRANQESVNAVLQVQRHLTVISYARAVGFGLATAVFAAFMCNLLLPFAFSPLNENLGILAGVVGSLAGVGVGVYSRKRDGGMTRGRAALWLEERVPSLQFALATLSEIDADRNHVISDDAHRRLVDAVGSPDVSEPLRRSALLQLRVPIVLAVPLLLFSEQLQTLAMRISYRNSAESVIRFGAGPDTAATSSQALGNWRVRVVPPAYSALVTRTLDDAGQVAALVGSRIEVSGGDSESPTAVMRSTADSIAPTTLPVSRNADNWRAPLSMPVAPAEVRFALGAANRQLLLEPRADSIPVVHLHQPTRDSVFRESKGTIALDASANDDLGLATVNFELIVTSGEGERFTATTVVLGAQRLSGEHERKWRSSFSLDTMKLVAGDIVHMRAVARDRHPDAAHEPGASETRTFRIARPNEYDSVAVEPAPPPEMQKSLMSQRMLLILTEKLAARRTSIGRDVLVAESRKLASDQVKLRKAIGNLVFQRLEGEDSGEHAHSADDGHEHGVTMDQGKLVPTTSTGAPMTDGEGGESPIVAINKPLLEAFNAMWDAASSLEIAEPKAAIPHMKLALAAIERARSAERIYL
ncbi:MAG: hypothetical protein H7Z40_04310, partial [Phycisphaerae bacterium]|nr:hypothetical protein [Gemmatimonadaceae bacterium]